MFYKPVLSYLVSRFSAFHPSVITRNTLGFIRKSSTAVPPWREAASLIIITELPSTKIKDVNSYNYNLLMVKRSESSSFLANAFVFPGGQVELSDFSPQWWNIFEKFGPTREEISSYSNSIHGSRPPIISDSMTLKHADQRTETLIPTNIALRISALRETFEETGVLLLRDRNARYNSQLTQQEQKMWQSRIHNDSNEFLALCIYLKQCPDIWSLYEWSNWLTPQQEAPKRYDTMFYICCLPYQPDILLEESELTVKKWCSPEVVLDANDSRNFFLPPPQVYELSRLLAYKSIAELKLFAESREVKGCQRFLPILKQAADGFIVLLPGDDEYGSEFAKEHQTDTVESMRHGIKNLHRLEITKQSFISHCNITPENGHLPPIINKAGGRHL